MTIMSRRWRDIAIVATIACILGGVYFFLRFSNSLDLKPISNPAITFPIRDGMKATTETRDVTEIVTPALPSNAQELTVETNSPSVEATPEPPAIPAIPVPSSIPAPSSASPVINDPRSSVALRDPRTGMLADNLDFVIRLPPLLHILRANKINLLRREGTAEVTSSLPDRMDESKLDMVFTSYLQEFTKRLSPNNLKFQDRLNVSHQATSGGSSAAGAFPTLRSVFGEDVKSFRSSSEYRDSYPLQLFHHVCYRYSEGAKPEMILLDDPQVNLAARISHALQAKPPVRWIPRRHDDEQQTWTGRLEPAEPDWTFIPGTTFSQLLWDKNPGHQFHQQVWSSFFVALQIAWTSFPAIPKPDYLLIDQGCATATSTSSDDASSDQAEEDWFGVQTDHWLGITQIVGRMALTGRESDLTILRSPDPQCRSHPHTVCFENLLLGDSDNQYMEYRPAESRVGLMHLRNLIHQSLGLDESMCIFPSSNTDAPLRVTAITREDSSRRRILNFDAISAALGQSHIVRRIGNFGARHPTEQLALLATTDVLIAPHGAHLTYSFLMPVNSIVFEIHADERVMFSWIRNFLPAIGIRHVNTYGIPNTNQLEDRRTKFRNMDRDFQVDITSMCDHLLSHGVKGCHTKADS